MAKNTNFLSIALLVSVLAVSPAFATEDGDAGTQQQQGNTAVGNQGNEDNPGNGNNGGNQQVPPVPVVQAQTWKDKVASHTNTVLNGVDYVNPLTYANRYVLGENTTKARFVKYAAVVGLVASHPTVQGGAVSVYSAIANLFGASTEEEADEAGEPSRLVIGRQA